jgi:hypothetical protein
MQNKSALPAVNISNRILALLTIGLFCLVLRVPLFGNPSLNIDEGFYLLVAERMSNVSFLSLEPS